MTTDDGIAIDRDAFLRATRLLVGRVIPLDEAVILRLVITAYKEDRPLSRWHYEQWQEISARYA